ncbi:concanavalin A-like lectin/glucanase domain-containing protein [Camillea tinctor]|nr:concanavalin A-like lectin/glucanase domain-containing protein [Camillea tinctor]
MASSFLLRIGAAAAAYAVQATATQSYQVTDVYDSTNFVSKFNFVSSTDPNGGYVSYQSKANAQDLELVTCTDDEVYIGVEHTSNDYETSGTGRKSIRLESKTTYNKGLVIANFSHLPKPVCGSWPSFWLFGEPWPTKGEVDIYENWNDLTFNRYTAHVDAPSVVGDCTIVSDGMLATIDSPNCYDHADGQYDYQGCSASYATETFGSATGGIYAMEWTSDSIRMWDWTHDAAPADVLSGNPAPSVSNWGTPNYVIKECDIEKAFSDMKLVFSLDFCAVAGQTDKWASSCQASTGYDTCTEYVASQGTDFEDVYFQVKEIKFYELAEDISTSASSSAAPMTTGSTTSVNITSPPIFANTSTVAPPTATASTPNDVDDNNDDDETCSDDEGYEGDEGDEDTTATYPAATYGSATTATPIPYETTKMTTSTIYATTVYTVTSCAPTVTNCPANHYVTTETISIGTTVCPVTEAGSSPQPTTATAAASSPKSYTTKTVEVTKIYTVTSCKPTVTDCPANSVKTEVRTTTIVAPVIGGDSGSGSGAGTTVGTAAAYAGAGSESEGTATALTLPTTALVLTSSATTTVSSVNSGDSTATTSTSESGSSSTGSDSNNGGVAVGVGSSGNTGSTGSTGTSSSSKVVAYITETVIPVTIVNTGGYGYNGTLVTAVPSANSTGYITNYKSASSSGSSYSTSSSSSSSLGSSSTGSTSVIEVNGGVKTGASVALMGIAVFFIFAM